MKYFYPLGSFPTDFSSVALALYFFVSISFFRFTHFNPCVLIPSLTVFALRWATRYRGGFSKSIRCSSFRFPFSDSLHISFLQSPFLLSTVRPTCRVDGIFLHHRERSVSILVCRPMHISDLVCIIVYAPGHKNCLPRSPNRCSAAVRPRSYLACFHISSHPVAYFSFFRFQFLFLFLIFRFVPRRSSKHRRPRPPVLRILVRLDHPVYRRPKPLVWSSRVNLVLVMSS